MLVSGRVDFWALMIFGSFCLVCGETGGRSHSHSHDISGRWDQMRIDVHV